MSRSSRASRSRTRQSPSHSRSRSRDTPRNHPHGRSSRRSASRSSRSLSRHPQRPLPRSRDSSPLPENASEDSASQTSSKRARSPSSQEEETKETGKRFKLDTATLKRINSIGRIFGRQCDMWVNPLEILRVGMSRDPSHDPALFTMEENLLYNAFVLLAEIAPDLVDHLQEVNLQPEPLRGSSLRAISSALNAGRKSARGDDVKNCKKALRDWVCDWVPQFPSKKSQAGFHHALAGKLLSPVREPWNETTRTRCLNHEIDTSPDSLCRLLFAAEEDDTVSFLKHDLLVKCYKHIFTGPASAVQMEGSGRMDTNGSRHGITSVSIPAIAYCAVLVHFCLSSQSVMGQGSPTNGYQYGRMYRLLLETCEALGAPGQRALLAWWDQKVYLEHSRPVQDSAVHDLITRLRATAATPAPPGASS